MSAEPPDRAARERLVADLATTFFVEAGAGTGKTRELVARIVALVAEGLLTMDGLAAITFTEAAAAELRDRVRQELARAAAESVARTDGARRDRCARAAAEVDLAAISTIHAFAATLLRSFPLQAGLPPGLVVLDEIQQQQAFDERFRLWLYDDVPDPSQPARRAAVARVFGLGMKPDQLQELARSLQDRYDLLGPGRTWPAPPPPDAVAVAHEWGEALIDLEPLAASAHDPEGNPLARDVRRVQFAARQLRGAADEEQALVALQRYLARPASTGKGKKADFDPFGEIADPCKYIKDVFRNAKTGMEQALAGYRTAALGDLLTHLADFSRAYAAERRAQGTPTFHDLLVWARDLVRDQPDVRRAAAERYQRLFVDEFQDTDPLQAELVVFVAANPRLAEEKDWHGLLGHLVPGKLFLVGDPKQSIYRFRGADIGVYEALYASTGAGAERLVLGQTRRTVAPIVAWVNHHFGQEMQGVPGIQAVYEPLVPRPSFEGLSFDESGCGVRHVGGPVTGRADLVWGQEAEAVAMLAHQVRQAGWMVTERQGDTWRARPADFGDVCVLLPARTNLRRLERAFQRLDVPYRMESGSLVLQTQEVRDLLACLRAVDDPSDQVALLAALRSPAFTCSDVDLLAWVEAGGALSYEAPGMGCDGPVRAAFAVLAEFHAQRMQRTTAETIERFVRDRGLAIQALGQPRPREAWRRIRYVVAQAHRLAGSGQTTLRGLLDWLDQRQRSTTYDPESVLPDGDEQAVRLMTVHGAKGLEFPVVILTGLGHSAGRRDGVKVIASHLSGVVEARCGDFQTAGYDKDLEERLDEAERMRLAYVAATRAREHLVLCLFHTATKGPPKTPTTAHRILGVLDAGGDDLCQEIVPAPPGGPAERQPEPDEALSPDAHAHAEAAWQAERTALVQRLGSERVATPSGLNRTAGTAPNDDERETLPPTLDEEETVDRPRTRRGGTALGLAVHAVLEWLDFETLANLDDLVTWAAGEQGVDEADVRAYALRVAHSAPVRAAVASGRYWREAPVAAEVDGVVVEGAIDLLYEREDGTLAVVDYKTDQLSPSAVEARAGHYAVQVGAYALTLQAATGKRVGAVELVFAALDQGGVVTFGEEQVEVLAERARAGLGAVGLL